MSDLRRLPEAVDRATELARGRRRSLRRRAASRAGRAASSSRTRLALWSDETAAWDGPVRSRLAARLMSAASAAGGDCNGTLTTAATELAVATSAGARQHAAASEAGFSLTQRVGPLSSYLADLSRHAGRLGVEARAEESLGSDPVVPASRSRCPTGASTSSSAASPPANSSGSCRPSASPPRRSRPASARSRPRPARRSPTPRSPSPTTRCADVGLPFPFDLEGTAKQRVTMLDRRPGRRRR